MSPRENKTKRFANIGRHEKADMGTRNFWVRCCLIVVIIAALWMFLVQFNEAGLF